MIRRALTALADPATQRGTALWVALGLCIFDVHTHGLTEANGLVLLVLAGLKGAAHAFGDDGPGSNPPGAAVTP